MICHCGRRIDSITRASLYTSMTVDSKGNIIYAVCIHGDTVIDKRPKKEEEDGE